MTAAAPAHHVGATSPPSARAAQRAIAALRIGTGFVFLWAFLDKTFGLGYSTPWARAWINGGSPTNGFLADVEVGPFQSLFHDLAGTATADVLFMLGLLGIGTALMAGVGVRIAAVCGVVLVASMWLATFPPAVTDSTGAATGSTNPFLDDHILELLVLVVLGFTAADSSWGLGRVWARIPFIARHRWAR